MRERDGGGRIQPPELARLPWEFLYDPRRDDCLALSASLARYAEVMERCEAVAPPLRILGTVASPAGMAPLDADQRRVGRALERLRKTVVYKWDG